MLDKCQGLTREMFSVSLLGNVYGQLLSRYQHGLDVSVAALADLNSEEMSHITGILHRYETPVSEEAFADCVRIVRSEHQASNVSSEDDLLAYQNKLKERKGLK